MNEDIPTLHARIDELEASLAHARSELAAATTRVHEYQEEVLHLEVQSALTQLVRGLAHEINNPLAVVLGHTQRLFRLLSDGDHRRRCRIIEDEAQRCIALVERLRSYATPMSESLVPCSIDAVVDLACQRMREHGHTPLPVELGSDLPEVMAARRALARALEAVFDNAAIAGASAIGIHAEVDGERVRLTIDNDGDTPTDEAFRNAIKPFYTTRKDDGASGLGLALSASLLREMGASITLIERPHSAAGARVVISIAGAPQRRRQTDVPDDGFRVLVVDDEPMVAEILGDAIAESGHRVDVVGGAGAARVAVARQVPDAALIDITLPDGDGLDLVRELGAEHPELIGHMALVTGDPTQPAIKALQRHFGVPVLGKPFQLGQVADLLRRLL